MAKHASALKQQRSGVKRRARNRKNVSQLKTQVKKLRGLIRKETVSAIDQAARKGVIHDNAAARFKSRLTKHVNGVKAPAAR